MKEEKNISALSLYWKCQLTGWSFAALYWALTAWIQGGFNFQVGLLHFILDIVVGIGITHIYHNFAHRQGWTKLRLNHLPGRLIAAIFIMGILYMLLIVVKLFLVRYFFNYSFDEKFGTFFRQNYLVISATGIRLMAIWALAFHLYHYALMEIHAEKESARSQVVARDAQLQLLSAQLNPHFFFNSLNSIKALITTDPVKARRAIDLLSDLLRTSLYEHDTGLIPLYNEISLVNDYLELETIRFEDRLQYAVNIEDNANECLILPLSIHTLVENAIKHGIAHRKNGGCITVNVEKQEENIKITVQNPGSLDTVGQTDGLGLHNLRQRLELRYHDSASLAITQSGEWVLSTIIIPAS